MNNTLHKSGDPYVIDMTRHKPKKPINSRDQPYKINMAKPKKKPPYSILQPNAFPTTDDRDALTLIAVTIDHIENPANKLSQQLKDIDTSPLIVSMHTFFSEQFTKLKITTIDTGSDTYTVHIDGILGVKFHFHIAQASLLSSIVTLSIEHQKDIQKGEQLYISFFLEFLKKMGLSFRYVEGSLGDIDPVSNKPETPDSATSFMMQSLDPIQVGEDHTEIYSHLIQNMTQGTFSDIDTTGLPSALVKQINTFLCTYQTEDTITVDTLYIQIISTALGYTQSNKILISLFFLQKTENHIQQLLSNFGEQSYNSNIRAILEQNLKDNQTINHKNEPVSISRDYVEHTISLILDYNTMHTHDQSITDLVTLYLETVERLKEEIDALTTSHEQIQQLLTNAHSGEGWNPLDVTLIHSPQDSSKSSWTVKMVTGVLANIASAINTTNSDTPATLQNTAERHILAIDQYNPLNDGTFYEQGFTHFLTSYDIPDFPYYIASNGIPVDIGGEKYYRITSLSSKKYPIALISVLSGEVLLLDDQLGLQLQPVKEGDFSKINDHEVGVLETISLMNLPYYDSYSSNSTKTKSHTIDITTQEIITVNDYPITGIKPYSNREYDQAFVDFHQHPYLLLSGTSEAIHTDKNSYISHIGDGWKSDGENYCNISIISGSETEERVVHITQTDGIKNFTEICINNKPILNIEILQFGSKLSYLQATDSGGTKSIVDKKYNKVLSSLKSPFFQQKPNDTILQQEPANTIFYIDKNSIKEYVRFYNPDTQKAIFISYNNGVYEELTSHTLESVYCIQARDKSYTISYGESGDFSSVNNYTRN